MAILENTFPKLAILGNTFRKAPRNRKIGKAESLVIVAGGNLTEIRPLLTLPRKWRNFKMGPSEVMILANTFPKSDDSGKYFLKSGDYGKHFSKSPVKS